MWEYMRTPVPQLPIEILERIFTYLTFADLKYLRLVCRDWMLLLNATKFREKFGLRLYHSSLRAIRNRFNKNKGFATGMIYTHVVIYENTPFSSAYEKVIQTLGSQIVSVVLKNATTWSFLQKLPNLKYLTIYRPIEPDGRSAVSDQILSNLIEFNVLAPRFMICDYVREIQDAPHLMGIEATVEEMLVTDFFEIISQRSQTLKKVKVYHPGFVRPRREQGMIWAEFFAQLKRLEHLSINSTNPDMIELVLKSVRDAPLKSLTIACTRRFYPDVFESIFANWSDTLEVLNISGLNIKSWGSPMSCAPAADSEYTHQNCLLELDVSTLRILDEIRLCELAVKFRQLTVLNLKSCGDAVTDKSLVCIFRYLTKLRTLNLANNLRFTDSGMIGHRGQPYSIMRLHLLENLNLLYCTQLTDSSLLVAFSFKYLRQLKLYSANYTGGAIGTVVYHCPILEELVLIKCSGVAYATIFTIADRLPRLRVLHMLHGCQSDEDVVPEKVECCKYLESLYIAGINCTPQYRRAIVQMLGNRISAAIKYYELLGYHTVIASLMNIYFYEYDHQYEF